MNLTPSKASVGESDAQQTKSMNTQKKLPPELKGLCNVSSGRVDKNHKLDVVTSHK